MVFYSSSILPTSASPDPDLSQVAPSQYSPLFTWDTPQDSNHPYSPGIPPRTPFSLIHPGFHPGIAACSHLDKWRAMPGATASSCRKSHCAHAHACTLHTSVHQLQHPLPRLILTSICAAVPHSDKYLCCSACDTVRRPRLKPSRLVMSCEARSQPALLLRS